MNINSGITSETLSTLCVLTMLELKQLITTSCVAKILLLSDRVSSIEFFEINVEFRNMNDSTLISLLLFGSEEQTFDVNTKILNLTIQFLKDTGRFDEPLI